AARSSISSNPTVADIDITTNGTDWLWAVFAVMLFTTIGILVYANFFVPRHHRAFVYLSAAITGTASVAYFSMAADLGATPVRVEFLHGFDLQRTGGLVPTRSIWYARYIDWTITTPLLLLELLLVSGMPLSNVFLVIFWDIIMIETGLIGSLVESQYKWGFYVFGCVAMFLVFYDLYFVGWSSAKKLDASLGSTYIRGTAMLTFLWFLYPIAWGLADGGNQISPDGEMIFYGILDLLAKPVFAVIHLWGLRKLDYDVLGLQSGKRSAYMEESGNRVNNAVSGKALESGHHNGAAANSTTGPTTGNTGAAPA
ncbi:family A G protein-coupled receptor-like protein, partial [Jaminaea rosea]